MMSRSQQAGATSSGRKILVSVNASAESEDALQWTLQNLYRPGDVLHFLHVVPRQEPATTYGAPPIDFLPQQNPKSVQKLAEQAQSFIKDRLLPMLGDMQPEPVVHVVKVCSQSLLTLKSAQLIDSVLCCSRRLTRTLLAMLCVKEQKHLLSQQL